MTWTSRPPQRIRKPIDAVLAIPRSLGFTPESSFVVVALNRAREVGLIARFDMAALEAPEQWFDGLHRAIRSSAPQGTVILCVYAEPGDEATAIEALRTLTPMVARAERPIIHRLAISDARYHLLDAPDDSWHPVSPPAFPQRSRLVAELAPAAAEECDEVSRQISVRPDIDADARDVAIDQALDLLNRTHASPEDIASLLVGLRDLRVRDTVLWDLIHQRPHTWRRAGDALAHAVRVAPDSHAAPAASLLSILRWQVGDGTRAVIALERALAAEPAYSLAHLIDAMLTGGLHPQEWREGLASLPREACRCPEILTQPGLAGGR